MQLLFPRIQQADTAVNGHPHALVPAPAAADDLGELSWTLTLEAGQQAVVRHRFTVEHPASVTLAGL